MPTAAKLIAAIVMIITGYLTAEAVRPFLPEGLPTKWLIPVSALVPAACSWKVVGRLAGRGYNVAVSMGIYVVFVSVFFVLLVFAISEMLKRSIRLQYDGPMDAIVNMFGIVIEYGVLLINPTPAAYLIGAALLVGPLAEWGHRKWG